MKRSVEATEFNGKRFVFFLVDRYKLPDGLFLCFNTSTMITVDTFDARFSANSEFGWNLD